MTLTEGSLKHGLPYYALGEGEPLAVLRWLSATHANPEGFELKQELKVLRPLASHHRLYVINRAPGMAAGTSMADVAAQHAEALTEEFGEPVNVMGMSSGGSLALQLAADHPGVVKRLVLGGTAAVLPDPTRAVQLRYANALAAGRRGAHFLVPVIGRTALSRAVLRPMMWLMDPMMRPKGGASDLLHFVQAEDAFDLRERLGEITAPTLLIGGEHDLAYTPELFRRTADGVRDGRLIIYPGVGHMGTFNHRRFAPDILAFLSAAGED